jgi:hypothetical protein
MVFEGADRKLELASDLGGRDTLGFEMVGGIQINVNRLAACHRVGLLLWMSVDSTGVYIGGGRLATVVPSAASGGVWRAWGNNNRASLRTSSQLSG